MIALPPELHAALRANAAASRAADPDADRFDPVPVIKLFNPLGAATWLATELHDDGDTLFGLADLGFGCPELGTFSLSEIRRIHLPFGLRIERDTLFCTNFRLSVWADWSRRSGSILWAETLLNRVALARAATGLPAERE
jgi:hypothetical protein